MSQSRLKRMRTVIPPPRCKLGYPQDQLAEILGDRLDQFNQWISGQTIGVCNGRMFDHGNGVYLDTKCGPHGPVVYRDDLLNFLSGGKVFD